MRKLLRAEFSRLWRSKIFYLGLILMVTEAIYGVINNYYFKNLWAMSDITPDGILFISTTLLPIVAAVFIAFFVGVEHGDRTIRNKIIAGHSRLQIYLSELIVCSAASLMMYLSGVLVVCAVGPIALGGFQHLSVLLPQLLCSFLSIVAWVALLLIPAFLISNRAVCAIVLLLVALVLQLYLPDQLAIWLEEPEFVQIPMLDENGNFFLETDYTVSNPMYLSGFGRVICQFFYDFLPTAQLYQLGDFHQAPAHLARFPFYAVLAALAATVGGVWLFRRENIK